MIDSLRGRAAFDELRHSGVTAHRGPMSLVLRHDAGAPVLRVGFAVPKAVGGAVVRNRIRRRLRELIRSSATVSAAGGGDALLICRPAAAALSFDQLGTTLDELFASALRRAS